VSLTGAREKIAQIDNAAVRKLPVALGMPSFSQITGRG
jgi:hypothetical protein